VIKRLVDRINTRGTFIEITHMSLTDHYALCLRFLCHTHTQTQIFFSIRLAILLIPLARWLSKPAGVAVNTHTRNNDIRALSRNRSGWRTHWSVYKLSFLSHWKLFYGLCVFIAAFDKLTQVCVCVYACCVYVCVMCCVCVFVYRHQSSRWTWRTRSS
jgi:hypothetical protein